MSSRASNKPSQRSGRVPTQKYNGHPEPTEERVVGDHRDVDDIGLDHIFSMLGNSRRRIVLQYLREQGSRVTIGSLAEHIAALENECSPESLSARERKRAYVGLYQCHLPKLDDLDIIEFDKDRGTLELGPNAPLLESYLYQVPEEPSPWPVYYMSLAGVGMTTLLGTSAMGLLTTQFVVIVLGALCASFVALAVAHYVRSNDLLVPLIERLS